MLRKLRHKRGMTLQDVVDAADMRSISLSSLSRYERGLATPSPEVAHRLADVLLMSPAQRATLLWRVSRGLREEIGVMRIAEDVRVALVACARREGTTPAELLRRIVLKYTRRQDDQG